MEDTVSSAGEAFGGPMAQALVRPLTRVLRPLVRLLIQSGVTFPLLAAVLRALYVEVAAGEILREGRSRTDSRISLLTGVHRKEIRRLRTEAVAAENVPPRVTLTSHVVARWLATPGCTDAAGQPLPLPRAGAEPSFESLVAALTTDVRPRAVLDDLISQSVVALDAQDHVRLNTAAFIPRPGTEEQLFYFGRNLHDHIAAAAANLRADGVPPFLDRSVHYDQLGAEAAAALERFARERAQHLLVEVNRHAAQLAEDDDRLPRPAGQPLRRVNLGLYLFVDDDTAAGKS